ncbi:MAG: ThuA domain-containing protein [Oscillospiraceae bacterium]|nr:ThuA domain-containing protein [Oscillospiraceae bacterium]
MINVTVWHEYVHEKNDSDTAKMYPKGIHGCIADFLSKDPELNVRTSTLDMPNQGLPDEVLNNTDVLTWWGHAAHQAVDDALVEKIKNRVLCGMGLIVLHSGHYSKIFKALMGTSCSLRWRDATREHIWCVNPSHPIAKGVPEDFKLESEEMYGEFFDIPKPDDIVYLGWFNGGEVFRTGCVFNRGRGKVFYLQPGHETNGAYHNENIQKIISNAVKFLYNDDIIPEIVCPCTEPVE